LRIVFGVGNYSHGYGIANVVHDIVKELLSQGNDVLVLAGKGNLIDDVPFRECGYNETLKHASITKTLKAILKLRPDIFHSHYYPMDFCGALASSKVKHVMHVHGILKKEYWINGKAALECLRSSLTESVGLRFSAKVITVSKFLKFDILKKYKMPADQIEVIYPSVDLNLYSPNNRSRFRAAQVSEDEISLLSVGAISQRKGQHLLVDAMREIVKDAPKTRLFLIGRTGEEDASYILRLRQRIRKFRLENNVLIKGFLPTSCLPDSYAQADVFVTGTMWEGFGMPLAEAMASGVPVVAFDTASTHELITNEVNGLKAPPFNTNVFAQMVLRLIQEPRLRREMGKNGRWFAEKEFEIKRNVHRLIEIYQSLS